MNQTAAQVAQIMLSQFSHPAFAWSWLTARAATLSSAGFQAKANQYAEAATLIAGAL